MLNRMTVGLILCSFLISGCDSTSGKKEQAADPNPVTQMIKVLFGSLKAKPATKDIRNIITRQAIDASPTPVLLVGIKSRNAHATLSPAGENHGVVTWVTSDGISIGINQGLLVSTRGLGQDLMSANVSNVLPGIRKARGNGTRVHSYLNGENIIEQYAFNCTYSNQGPEIIQIYGLNIRTSRIAETCKNQETNIVNQYWVSGASHIWQSRQWIGPDLGHVFIQQLSR